MKRRVSTIILLVCLALAGAAQYFITRGEHPSVSFWLFSFSIAISAIVLGLSGAAGCVRGDGRVLETAGERGRPARILWRLAAAAGAGLVFHASWELHDGWNEFYFAAPWFYAAGLALLALGLDRVGRRVVRWRRWRAGRRLEIVLFLAILGVGIFMRAHRLDYYPPPDGALCPEEAQQGGRAYKLLYKGGRFWEFYDSNLITAAAFTTLGASMSSLRIPPVILASLTLVPFYLLVRLLMGYRVALASTFLFAVSRWHLCYARIAHNIFLPVFFVTLLLYLLVRSRHCWRPSIYVWTGTLSALLLFSYAGYRSMALVAVLYLGYPIVRLRRSRKREGEENAGAVISRWKSAAGLGLAVATAAAIALPIFHQVPSASIYFEAARRTTRPHQGYYGEDDLGQVIAKRWKRLEKTAKIFTYRGDSSPTTNLPGEPMLDPVTGLLFFLGLACALATPKRNHHPFFLALFFLGIFLGAVFVHNLDVRRLISVIPLVYIFVAIALSSLWSFAVAGGGGLTRRAAAVAAFAVCGVCLWYNHAVFFGEQATSKAVRAAFKNPYTIVVDRIKDLPQGSYVVLVSPIIHNMFAANDLSWLKGDRIDGRCVRRYEQIFPLPEQENLFVVFQSPHDVKAMAERLEGEIPGTVCSYHADPDREGLEISLCSMGPLNENGE